jgi:hypothetical protein
MENTVLLSTAYFGPIRYFSRFLLFPQRIIERFDNYSKQSYRNRCRIYGANGILSLSIPVLKGPAHKTLVRDIRIDYSKNWPKLHWKGIESAYMHSPFFEFYMDDIRAILEKQHKFLLDINLETLDYLLECLEIDGGYTLSETFTESGGRGFIDCRENIHPKREAGDDEFFRAEPYNQIFSERFGFQADLSIIDLLFNEGPNAGSVLENCLVRT